NEVLDKYFSQLEDYLSSKTIYSEIGIVVRPDLQGKGSGATKELYNLLSNGIIFAWTSNPLYLAQCYKYFNNVQYFPLFEDRITTLEGLANLSVLYGDLLTYKPDRTENLEFGALRSEYFVTERGNEYLDLAKSLVESKKISQLDEKRIQYCIQQKGVQGAIIATN
nr:hypothetical protein [Candidatus Dojkabacteria bacterium]